MFDFLFKRSQGIIKNFLIKQVRNHKHEDFGYKAALLALSRNKFNEIKRQKFFLEESDAQNIFENIYEFIKYYFLL